MRVCHVASCPDPFLKGVWAQDYMSWCFLPCRQITQALSVDERGERMEALELYNKALTALQSGLAKLSGDDLRLKEIQGKMEK